MSFVRYAACVDLEGPAPKTTIYPTCYLDDLKVYNNESQKSLSEIFQNNMLSETKLLTNKDISWFHTQLEMFEYAKTYKHTLMIASDYLKPNGDVVKRYYSFPNYQIYLKILPNLVESDRNWYELIAIDTKVKPVFDIEWYGMAEGYKHYEPHEIYNMIEGYLISIVSDYDKRNTRLNTIILESHATNKTKFSYHILLPDYYIKDHVKCGKALVQLVIDKINLDPESPLHFCLDKSGNPKLPIDTSIYTTNRVFRMKGHHKFSEPLRILKPSEGCEAVDECDYLVTVINNAKLLDIPLPSKNKRSVTTTKCLNQNNKDSIQKILDIIDITKIDRKDWINIGIALKREFGEDGLSLFDTFSQRFNCYDQDEMTKDWNSFTSEYNYNMGTIYHYAKTTNPNCTTKINGEYFLDAEDLALANVFYEAFPHSYVCYSIKKQVMWYYFNGNYFVKTSDEQLKQRVIDYLLITFQKQLKQLFETMRSQNTKDEEDKLQDYIETTRKIIDTLRKYSKRGSIFGSLIHFYLNEEFPNLIDRNPYLLGFNNGVYNLKDRQFRPGKWDDYITMTTDYDYSDDRSNYREVDDFYNKIFSFSNDVKLFAIRSIARSLIGDNSTTLQNIYIWNGAGSNGKSCLKELINHTLGNYAVECDAQMIIQKAVNSTQAREDYRLLVGVRIVTMSEIEDSDDSHKVRLNSKIVKTFTGESNFSFRGLYESTKTYPILFTMFLLCNQRPDIKMDDWGMVRRLKYCPFMSNFVKEMGIDMTGNVFPIDPELSKKLPGWKMSHFHYLMDHLQLEFSYPKEVLEFGQECMKVGDPLSNIINDLFTISDDSNIGITLKEFKNTITSHPKAKEVKIKTEKELIEMVKKRFPNLQILDNTKQKPYHCTISGVSKRTTGVVILGILINNCNI